MQGGNCISCKVEIVFHARLTFNFLFPPQVPETEHEKTYSFPLDIQLKFENKRVQVAFGERDGVCMGHALLAVNGEPLQYKVRAILSHYLDILSGFIILVHHSFPHPRSYLTGETCLKC